MSDTSLAAVERLRRDFPHAGAIVQHLDALAPPERRSLTIRFGEILLSKAPRNFLTERSPAAIASLVEGAFLFFGEKGKDPVRVEMVDVPSTEGGRPTTVIRSRVTERPFIVDTFREFLGELGIRLESFVYPVLHAERDDAGTLLDVRPSREGTERESLIHCEVGRISDPDLRSRIVGELHARLSAVVRITEDHGEMRDRIDLAIREFPALSSPGEGSEAEEREVLDLLRWIRGGAFIFLGYERFDLRSGRSADELGLLRREGGDGIGIRLPEAFGSFPVPAATDAAVGGAGWVIAKTDLDAPIHRSAPMDYLAVLQRSPRGEPIGEHRFIGLFTSHVHRMDAHQIPILRRKLRTILDRAGVSEGTHDYKEIQSIFNSLPKDELFLTSVEEIDTELDTILRSYGTGDVRVTLRNDPLRRGISVTVSLPKDRYSGEVHQDLAQAVSGAFAGEILSDHLAIGTEDQARLHFHVLPSSERVTQVKAEALESIVRELIRNWEDRVRQALLEVRSEEDSARLARHYAQACSPEYQAAVQPAEAVQDILELEALRESGGRISFSFPEDRDTPTRQNDEEITALKVYVRGLRLVLSDFMPILENAGLRVVAVSPFEVQEDPDRTAEAIVYLFAVQGKDRRPIPSDRTEALSSLVHTVWREDASNDGMNELVLGAGLNWREIEVLRSYASYAFQLGAVPSRASLPGALLRYPEIARLLYELFETRLDPAGEPDRGKREQLLEKVRARLRTALTEVGTLADDRALRRMGVLIDATWRTNYWRGGGAEPTRRSGGVPYISLKFHVPSMESLNPTRLRYEVWVRSPRMEGIHLRGAKVARGGIRWSDRHDDFRTEVAGLVKTQMVKNAVIVPAGSKGGFVTLRNLPEPEAQAEEGKEQYRTFARGLLDLSDNIVEGETIPPPDVYCWDDPDPYMVVAADKGTAKFSDVANGVAAEYDFWLGDAFASGGSHGYDHKSVGITARGAWECVRRHFRELGKDIQSEPFTVVGIGDMSGDVFGNGMLLSKAIRLVAAVDHRHVFIDPDPDPARGWEERNRLFHLGRSSWDDYDRSLLGEGGAIIPRGAKSVELHPAAREALGLTEDEEIADGEALVRAVLRAPVDLFWNGGIGTYVKAASESHTEVGDPSNDSVRVNAEELRARVVGEGGNLGFTQKARIAFALRGGRNNTDALDNSGGVDLSDHEVNLKILLGSAVRAGSMTMEERNILLEELTESVAELVLTDNRTQSRAISLDEIRAKDGIEDFRQLMSALERAGLLDRADEDLPSWETLVERREEGISLTRPELCILLAYAKMSLTSRILGSDLPDDDAAEGYLIRYFPQEVVDRMGVDALRDHRLRREIIAGQLSNSLVDLMGAGFVERMVRETGASSAEIAKAWLLASRLAGAQELTASLLEAESRIPAPILTRWTLGLARVLERSTRWILAHLDLRQSIGEGYERLAPTLAQLREHFGEVVAGADRFLFEELVEEMAETGAERTLAQSLITLRFLDQILEIQRIAERADADPLRVARAYFRIAEFLRLAQLRHVLSEMPVKDDWESRAAAGLMGDLTRAHQRITIALFPKLEAGRSIESVLSELLPGREEVLSRISELLEALQDSGLTGLAPAVVAVREIQLLGDHLAEAREGAVS